MQKLFKYRSKSSSSSPSATMPLSPLRQLANIISESVDTIDALFAQKNIPYPSLDEPFNPASPSEGLSMSPEAVQASMLIVAACAQLGATVKVPALTLYDISGGFHIASALRVALESNTIEILRGHEQGLHARDIAAQNGMDPTRSARVLRLLASHHVFREVTPDVFANNRLSSMMDTLKSLDDIKADHIEKHTGTPGMGALIEHTCDEVFKGSSFMTEVLLDPSLGHSEDPTHTPRAYAFKSNKPGWEWYEEPGNEFRLKRFTAAMEGSSKADPPDAINLGFKWADLPAGSVVVDVGGGIGHITQKIFSKNPNLKYVIQDRPEVIDQGKEFWSRIAPEALKDETVKLNVHDFFEPQPITNASVFLLRMITHDYGKRNATNILKQLRAAASPNTKLLVVDQVVPYACAGDEHVGSKIPGANRPLPPAPLLPNLGKANAIAYIGDFQMYVGLNGEERTIGTFIELFEGAGWTITRVFPIPGSAHSQILAIPK